MSAIMVDLDRFDTSDELAIDFSKMEMLKTNLDLIYELFQTCIEFGDIVKVSFNAPSKDLKQWLQLYGEEANRYKTKKYIMAICNPEFTQNVKINDGLTNKLEKLNFKKELIKAYQISIEISKQNDLILQGILSDVTEVKCIIDLEMNRYSIIDQAANNVVLPHIQKETISTNNNKQQFISSDNLNDDDVIWINDPYEMFETEATKENTKLRKSDEINSSFKKLSFLSSEPTSSLNSVTSSSMKTTTSSPDIKKNNEKLVNMALLNGFDMEEIEKGLADFQSENPSANIEQYAFIEYLKMAKKFSYSQQAAKINSGKKKKENDQGPISSKVQPVTLSSRV